MPESSRPKQQRAAANARYNHRITTAGLVKLNVLVPLVNLEELDRLAGHLAAGGQEDA